MDPHCVDISYFVSYSNDPLRKEKGRDKDIETDLGVSSLLVESRSSCFWCGIPVVLDSIGLKNYYNNTMHVKTQQKQYCLYFVNEEIG